MVGPAAGPPGGTGAHAPKPRRFQGPALLRAAALAGLALATCVAPPGASAGKADVVDARAACDAARTCRFVVTVRHADSGWDHYADRWEVLAPDGRVLATRVLRHPHVDEQPFTRALGGVHVPEGIDRVRVRAHDRVHGHGGEEVEVTIPASGAPAASAPESGRVAPRESKFELFVHDPAEGTAFYEALGLTVLARKDDGYTTLRSGPVVISLCPIPGWLRLDWLGFLRRPPLGTEIVLYSDDLERHRAQVAAAGFHPTEVVRQPWGLRDFRVTDPDGYYVRVTEGGP